MISEITEISLMVLTVLFALLTIELKDLIFSVLSFCGMCITIGVIFWLLNAPYVAVFQLLVYAGAIVVLFIASVTLTTRRERLK